MNELLDKCHKAHLVVLEDFKKVCDKHGLKWFAFCGTLLGAVRHKGFIPWDDDLDICMLRSDYNLFIKYAPKEMPGYSFDTYDSYTPEERRHYDFRGITRINNTYIASFKEEHFNKFCEFPYYAGIDLYPLDYVPADDIYEKALSVYRYLLFTGYKYKSLNWEGYTPPKCPDVDLETAYTEIYKATGIRINPNKDVLKQLNKLAVMAATHTKKSDRVACMMHTAHYHNLIFPKSAFKTAIKTDFENTDINIPCGFDDVLRVNYGDYMKPKQSKPHEYPYYKFQERDVMKFIIDNPKMSKHIDKSYIQDVYEEQKEVLDKIYE